MNVEQFVMAYEAEQDRLRAILPDGFISLRPVLRVNAEIRDVETAWVEFNTPAEKDGVRGWVNIGCWNNASYEREGRKVTFWTDLLEISFEGVGIEGRCPAEKDNAGCWFTGDAEIMNFRPAETITANKEYCDCSFRWLMADGAEGTSTGETLPAYPTEVVNVYPKEDFTVKNAAKIPCRQVLGAYTVEFIRE
jgi:hypothetical protein